MLTQLPEFKEHKMNNPLELCELASRAPNIGAGHGVKQVWLLNDHVFILEFHFHTQMQGALGGSNIANRHCITHFALSLFYGETR